MLIFFQKLTSRCAGFLSNTKINWLKNWIINLFVYVYRPDMQEAVYLAASDYLSFNDFFTRRLKPGARSFAKRGIVSPADGKLHSYGKVTNEIIVSGGESDPGGRIDNIKDRSYSVARLLGLNLEEYDGKILGKFKRASYAIIYLAPHNYHRVHFPCDAVMTQARFIPGSLFSVNTGSSIRRPSLYAYNQRLACFCETEYGFLGIVMVAALMVSTIGTSWGAEHRAISLPYTDKTKRKFRKGDELGYFSLGSSVVLLWMKERKPPRFIAGSELRAGQVLY